MPQNESTTAAASTAKPVEPKPSHGTSLPWALVAVLSAISLILATLLFVKTDELNKLRADTADGPVQTQTSGAPAPQKQIPKLTAQPTTGGNAPQIMALAKRAPNDPMAMGKPDAPITIIEWADYRCPFCAKWSLEAIPQLKPYIDSGSVRIEFRDFVIFGEESQAAANAARAAGNQGKYFEYANAIWMLHTGQGHPEIPDSTYRELAQKVGVKDLDKFDADRRSSDTTKASMADSAQAQQLGLNSTPFFLVNTTPVSGALPAETFIDLIQQYGGKK